MFEYKKYRINETDNFRPDDFPKVIDELSDLNKNITGFPAVYKAEILISFFKTRSLNKEWLTANPELTGLISNGSFPTGQLESLFDSSRTNKRFQQQYEEYIRESLL